MLVKPLVRPIVRAIAGNPTASLGSGFSPTSLFADGSKGVVYDNNDLSSFYLDSAGVTPATVNGLVGLQLDKSAGLTLGAEAVTNGDFSGGATGWTLTSSTVSGGALSVNSVSTENVAVSTATVPAVSAWYYIEFDVTVTSGQLSVFVNQLSASNKFGNNITTSGHKAGWVLVGLPGGGTNAVLFRSEGGFVGTIDNVTVKPYSGNHRYQTTTGSKPVLRGTPIGSNLVTNGDFASGTGWTAGAGWAIGSGVATATASTTSLECTQFSVTIGKTYRVRYTMTRTGGSLVANMGGVNDTSRLASGTYEVYITATNTNPLRFTGFGPFTGTVDDVEVFDVSAGQVTAPYGLQYDGVDDFLQTAAVDFTATDKMFVCAGVRKLSDAARGLYVELGNVPGVNTFRIEAPPAAVAAYTIVSGGTVLASLQSTSSFAAPITNVLTGVMDIAADSLRMRLNASEQTPVSTDQGTGNFSNNILYFGRRGGASLPYNGLDFGFVIVGKTLTSTQISSTERYIAQRTGIAL